MAYISSFYDKAGDLYVPLFTSTEKFYLITMHLLFLKLFYY